VKKAGDDGWYSLIFSKKAKPPRLRLARCLDWPGMILFGYYTGVRISDIAGLTWGNIELSSEIARFVPAKTKRQMPSYQVPLHRSLVTWLASQYSENDQRDPVFPSLFSASTSGHAYLCAVMDWYSRKVLGWAVSNTMGTELCLEALDNA